MAATDRNPTRHTLSEAEPGRAGTIVAPTPDGQAGGADTVFGDGDAMLFGDDVPTEEAGAVAMAGWSLVAAAIALGAVTVVILTVFRRRRSRHRTPSPVDDVVRPAVSRVVDAVRNESRPSMRRFPRRPRRFVGAASG